MGRGPGPTSSTIGFNVSAVSDDNDGQQPVQILRDGTNVSSGAVARSLDTFNQLPTFPPLVSKNGNTVLIAGTNVVNPIIGGIQPVGTADVQPAIKITAMNFNSPMVTNTGYVMSGSAGTGDGVITTSAVYNTEGTELLLAASFTYATDVTGADAPKFVDGGSVADVGLAPSTIDDSDIIGLGTYTGTSGTTTVRWINIQVRANTAGAPRAYDMTTQALLNEDQVASIKWEPAANILLSASMDTMMGTDYALDEGGTFDVAIASYPALTPENDTFTGVAPDTNGKQISFTDQTAGGGSGSSTIKTDSLYNFNVDDINVVAPTYIWTADKITEGIFGFRSTDIFTDFLFDQVTNISGNNNYAVDSSLPAAQGFVLYDTNGNKGTNEGLTSVSYSIGAAIVSAPEDGADGAAVEAATFNYSSYITIGTVVANNDSSQSGCDEMDKVDEGNGSAQLKVCGGEELKLSLTVDASFKT